MTKMLPLSFSQIKLKCGQKHFNLTACMIYQASGIIETSRRNRMTREKIVEAIQRTSENNRLSCEKAHELAKDLDTSLQELGILCNELKIKITACQLGCF